MRAFSAVVAAPVAGALVVTLALASASCPAGPPTQPPFVQMTSGRTTVTASLRPFSLAIAGAGGAAVGGTLLGDADCAPLALGLRPLDEINEWHSPHTLRGTEIWARSSDAVLVSEEPLTLDVTLGSGEHTARVVMRPSPSEVGDGWVDVDVTFSAAEIDTALVSACFALEEGEHLVGGGERFEGPDLRGRVIPLAFEAPGRFASSTNESHVPVPFVASTRGLGVLIESERVGAFDVGVAHGDAWLARFQGTSLPLRFRAGAGAGAGVDDDGGGDAGGIVDNVAAHARRMGLPPVPPRWALAPMQWRNDLEVVLDPATGAVVSSGSDMLLRDVDEMRARDIPFSTVWIDAPWQTGYNTFVVNEQQLPDIDAVFSELEARGLRVLTWATEHVNNSDDSDQAFGMPAFATREMFDEYASAGFLVGTAQGSDEPFTFPWGRGNGGYVDFTNDDACAAFQEQMRPLLERGVRGFKLDYGETMRADLLGLFPNDIPVFSDGTSTSVQHTRYARLYHECYARALDGTHGPIGDDGVRDWFIITRTGGIYDQRNGVAIWPGDLDSDFERAGDVVDGELAVGGVPAAVGGFLSLQMSGYPLYGADIGGYRGGTPTPEAFARWAQAGALSTIMQVGGGGNHAPWDPELVGDVDTFARAARLHMDLVPMWEHWLARASRDGRPVAVPVGVVAGDNEQAWADDMTFVIGDVLLAAPVVEDGARTRTLFAPAGTWRSWWDAADVVSVSAGTGALVTVDAPLDRVPLFVRDDAILVLSDPRIETLLPNGDEAGGADDDGGAMGQRRLVRAYASGPASSTTVGDIFAARFFEPDGTDRASARLEVLSDAPRPLIVELAVVDGSVIDAFGGDGADDVSAVADEAALLACAADATCLLREDTRVRLATRGRGASLTIELERGSQ